MPLQTSGQITLSDIQNVFGGAHPILLSEYYGADPQLPSSGTILMSQFYGLPSARTFSFDTGVLYNGDVIWGPYSSGGLGTITVSATVQQVDGAEAHFGGAVSYSRDGANWSTLAAPGMDGQYRDWAPLYINGSWGIGNGPVMYFRANTFGESRGGAAGVRVWGSFTLS